MGNIKYVVNIFFNVYWFHFLFTIRKKVNELIQLTCLANSSPTVLCFNHVSISDT